MLDYQEAPYLELESYKAPKGKKAIYMPMKDGKRIRLMYWKNFTVKEKHKGTIILQRHFDKEPNSTKQTTEQTSIQFNIMKKID